MRWLRPIFDVFANRDGRVAWGVVVAFCVLNGVVLVNVVLHDPRIGYDAGGHLRYAEILGQGRWPTEKETHEFFSPPLPYVPLALARQVFEPPVAMKVAQLVQGLCSIVLTFFLLKTARLIGVSTFGSAVALVCLGMLPAYYRTFAMIRGEPMLVTFLMIGLYLTLRAFAGRDRPSPAIAALAGIALGLAVVSRQWAFFALPALGLVGVWRLIVDGAGRPRTIAAGLVLLCAFSLVGLPFYVKLKVEHGSMRAFNRDPRDQKADGLAVDRLSPAEAFERMATRPVRDAFNGHPVLLFYADLWGDYWQYFLVAGKDRRGRNVSGPALLDAIRDGRARWTNQETIPAYLGRNALVGVVPTALLLAGWVGGMAAVRRLRRADLPGPERVGLPLLAGMALCTAAGYVWFVASYPSDNGDTVKSSYPLQLYPLLAIMAGERIGRWRGPVRWTAAVLLIGAAVHLLPACVTRYPADLTPPAGRIR